LNPVPTIPTAQPAKVLRHVLCVHYSECLDNALARQWESFSCASCRAFEMEAAGDPDWWNEQNIRSGQIIHEILVAKPPKITGKRAGRPPFSFKSVSDVSDYARGGKR
jgi:hypothetical protein